MKILTVRTGEDDQTSSFDVLREGKVERQMHDLYYTFLSINPLASHGLFLYANGLCKVQVAGL